MPISKKRFEESVKNKEIPISMLKFFYDHKDEAFSLNELLEENVISVDETIILGRLVGLGYIDVQYVGSSEYHTISKKGIKKVEKKGIKYRYKKRNKNVRHGRATKKDVRSHRNL